MAQDGVTAVMATLMAWNAPRRSDALLAHYQPNSRAAQGQAKDFSALPRASAIRTDLAAAQQKRRRSRCRRRYFSRTCAETEHLLEGSTRFPHGLRDGSARFSIRLDAARARHPGLLLVMT